jgi:uncharacterized BrkB/YihY/UPF0761 family membrane protein
MGEDTAILLKFAGIVILLILSFILLYFLIHRVPGSKKDKRTVLLVVLAFVLANYFEPMVTQFNKKLISEQSSNLIVFSFQTFLWLFMLTLLFAIVLVFNALLVHVFNLGES